jgi:hypothetical protein
VPGGYVRGGGQALISSTPYYYAYTDDGIFESANGAAFTARSATFLSAQVDFIQFDDIAIAACGTSNPTLYHTIGAASNFATLGSSSGTAPAAQRVGRINKFVLLGNTSADTTNVRWSGIDQPTSWPTPNSATAIAQQAGEQYMDGVLGAVTGFTSGDQFGIIFQETGLTRVSYVGPPVVLQFDKISDKVGCTHPRSIVQVGNIAYFIGTDSVYRTDGVTLADIGYGKVSRYFLNRLTGARDRVYAAANIYKKIIYWAFCNTSNVESQPSEVLIYNYQENRFSLVAQSCEYIYSTTGQELVGTGTRQIKALGIDNTLGSLTENTLLGGVPPRIYLGLVEPNPGGFARMSGVKFIADATSTARAVNLEYTNELGSTTITGLVTATAATGFSDFRVEARYFAPQFWAATAFDNLTAVELQLRSSGSR